MITFKNPSAPTFCLIYWKLLLWKLHFLKYGHFGMKLFSYVGNFLQDNAPIYIDVFIFNKVSSTYRYRATRQLLLLVNSLQNSTDAELAYYWASDISFDTSGNNKFADSGLKAAIIMGQYTIGIIPDIFYIKIFCKARIYVFTVFIVIIYTT